MIPIAMPLLAEEEAEAARAAVLSGWVSQGPQVAAPAGAIQEGQVLEVVFNFPEAQGLQRAAARAGAPVMG